MPFKKREKSPSSTPVPSTENAGAQLPEAEWDGMTKVLNAIYDYRTQDGFDPSKLFHRKVNKRALPEYYETIKEPMALSTIKQKINQHSYTSFTEFVRDFALIPHNAMLYNTPKSGAFQDALVIKEQIEKQLQDLVTEGVIDQATAALPDLGEIPTYEEVPEEEGEEEEEESDEDADEEEDEEEEEGAPKKKRGRPSLHKRDTTEDGGPTKRARGRPPKLLTPMEARIQAVLKGIRKPKNSRGQHLIKQFDRLPDKQAMPEYYQEVRNPMAYDILKRKVKRKKYKTLEAFLADVNLMFENAKAYNEDESQIHKDAVTLQIEAGRLYDIERVKTDEQFVDDEGKVPMPEGILHNGELYKVGDWVHIQNPNDLTKPIPAQIYRTYRSPNGQAMVNVCWYYRPEQTVHRYDKHFYDHEVVKTGRYKEHHVEEIEGRCFIMFTTRYFKGRPRGLPEDIEMYVCEARYNEEKALFNKVKTWTSCLPDEVREQDYEMVLYDRPKPNKKYPSPIKYLLRDDQKETDDLPSPEWGAEKAPPKIGAVHRRTRTDRDSEPPAPTPPPQPRMPTPPRQTQMPQTSANAQLSRPIQNNYKATFNASQAGMYAGTPQAPASRPITMQSTYVPHTPQPPLARSAPQPAHPTSFMGGAAAPAPGAYPPRSGMASSYREPPAVEVYTLPDQANLSIPQEVREQFRRDDQGRILFFTAPPIVPTETQSTLRGHSVRYLAAKSRRAEKLEEARLKRKRQDDEQEEQRRNNSIEQRISAIKRVDELKMKTLQVLEAQQRAATKSMMSEEELIRCFKGQQWLQEVRDAMDEQTRARKASRHVPFLSDSFEDDWDTRLT